MRHLLKIGVDPNIPDQDDDLPLLTSLIGMNFGFVNILLEHNADLETRTGKQQTVLLRFVSDKNHSPLSDCSDSICFLLKNKADMYATDYFGRNLLHYCAEKMSNGLTDDLKKELDGREPQQVRSMLEAKDAAGNTPLHLVCTRLTSFWVEQSLSCWLRIYQKFGADVNIPNHAGMSPIFCLIDQPEVAEVQEGIETFFKMGVDCFQTKMLTYVDGVKKQVTPLEYARIRELPKPDEENQEEESKELEADAKESPKAGEVPQASQVLKVSEFILACMADGKYELSRRYQQTAFLMARHRNPGALARLSNPLARNIFSFLKPVEPKAEDVKDTETSQKAERGVVRWHG